jgi:hypothetical protein
MLNLLTDIYCAVFSLSRHMVAHESRILKNHQDRLYEQITAMDTIADGAIPHCEDDGLIKDAIRFSYVDHAGHLSCAKRHIYEAGTPLIAHPPPRDVD